LYKENVIELVKEMRKKELEKIWVKKRKNMRRELEDRIKKFY
jgi:hypothetical protein